MTEKEKDVYQMLADHLGLTETIIHNDWTDKEGRHYRLTKLGFVLTHIPNPEAFKKIPPDVSFR